MLGASFESWLLRLDLAVGMGRARVLLRGCELGSRVYAGGAVEARRAGGRIVVGSGCIFVRGLEPTRLIGARGATLSLGAGTVVNYGSLIESNGGDVEIGRRCLLASGVRVVGAPGRGVRIGDDVWLAHGAVVTAGVRIGDGAVVSAAAVVSRDVPSGTLAIGNPARALELLRVPRADPRQPKADDGGEGSRSPAGR